ncbi:MAG TPA: polyprenyl synthetase family protein, partial [Jatrophihabitans sp.]|nr:polyprenyl synthetase family protein [Jatrophihabitans sp.]
MQAEMRTVTTPASIERIRRVVEPALRAEVERLADPRMRRIAGYQLGWWDADGTPTPGGGGKAIRPTLAVLAAEAAGDAAAGVPVAVALELVHNFSLLHDDIMDRDVERRHRPTGWVAFGEGQAILAGNAMLVAAIQTLQRSGEAVLTHVLDA